MPTFNQEDLELAEKLAQLPAWMVKSEIPQIEQLLEQLTPEEKDAALRLSFEHPGTIQELLDTVKALFKDTQSG